MYRDSKFTQRRSMRISVQKYLEQRGDAQPRQQVEQQRNSAAPRPAFFPVPADDNEAGPSGNRDNGNPIDRNLIERQPGSDRANAVAAPVEQAAAPAQQLHAAGEDLQPQAEPAPPRGNRGNPRGSRNRGAGYYDGYRQPQRNRPAPAPMAAPRQVEVVIPENERAQRGNNRNEQHGRGDDAFVVPYYHPVRYQGRGNNKRSSVEYRVRLSERLLPLKNLTAARARKIPSDDFHLVAEKGEAFSCAKGLLQSMCSCLDLSDRWDVNSLPIPCDADGVMTIITFAKKGTISFKKDSSVIKIIRAADFLGFESLLRVCITHVSGPYYPAEFIIEIHARLSHIDGIPEIFSQRLGELPLQVFDAKTEVPQNLLSSLNIEQLQKLLRDDNLQVSSEDYAVYLILQWMQAQKFDTKDKQAEMEELCFKYIRYPFITRCVQNLLKENSLNFTKERIVSNECLSESCRPRSGYDKHVHILWKQYRANRNGSSTFGVSCVTWNKNTQRKILERNRERNQDENQEENKFPVEERELSSIPNEQHPYEDHRCTQFTATGNKIVKMSCNRAHNRIFVHELNMQNSTVERRGRILLGRGDPYVDRPDPIVLKGTSDLTICYYDSGIKMTSYDPKTWRVKDFPTEEVRRLPMYPFEWGIFDDCAVAINSSRIVISEVDFTGAVEVELPYINGRFIDMERIGDHLFVLTDNAASRIVNQNSSDEIQVIDLKEKKLVRTSQLPAYPEDPWISRRNWDEFNDAVLRFAKIESELYVVCQRDRLTPLHIVSLDTVTYTSEVVASVVLPKPDESDPSSIHARSYLCGVPLGIVPCDKTPLRDLVNVPRPE